MLLEVFFCTYKVADYGIFFFLKSEKSCWMLKKFTFFQLSILISTISERLDKEIQNNLWLIESWKCHLEKTISKTWVLKQQFHKNFNYKQNKVFLTYWVNGTFFSLKILSYVIHNSVYLMHCWTKHLSIQIFVIFRKQRKHLKREKNIFDTFPIHFRDLLYL